MVAEEVLTTASDNKLEIRFMGEVNADELNYIT